MLHSSTQVATPYGSSSSRALSVSDLTYSYGGAPAVEDVSFEVAPGEIAALLGPSGCGKSTILRAIAGLVRPARGTITLGGADLVAMPARSRNIGMVFQNYALFPHLTVAENIAYPLACRHVPRALRQDRVRELLGLIRLERHGARLPRELSGGQQQRVAVARALAASPALLLLDEPFGALDRALRFDLQLEMLRLQKSVGITTLIVTHDQEEAQSLAGRLVLLNRGHVEQIDTPAAVYDRPRTLFANSFIGHANRFSGVIAEPGAGTTRIRLAAGGTLDLQRRLTFAPEARVTATCRPEEVRLVTQPGAATLPARLIVSVLLGPSLVHDLELEDGSEIRAIEPRRTANSTQRPGEAVFIEIDPVRLHVFPAEAGSPERGTVRPTAGV